MSEYVNCPKCGSAQVEKVSYTLWGGFIGPRMLNHVRCRDCKTTFNGKTGKSNNKAIAIYLISAFVIAFLIFFLASTMRG